MRLSELLQIINIMELNFSHEIDTNTKIDVNEERLRKSVIFILLKIY